MVFLPTVEKSGPCKGRCEEFCRDKILEKNVKDLLVRKNDILEPSAASALRCEITD